MYDSIEQLSGISTNSIPPTTTETSSNPVVNTSPSDDVFFTRSELLGVIPQYDIIRDCLLGERYIKARSGKYLPTPNSEDTTKENLARYAAYKMRAVFYNATGRTQKGMVGQIFARDPIVTLTPKLEKAILADVDGSGISLIQGAKRTAGSTLGYGRAGVFADYPAKQNATTLAEQASGEIRPVILHYEPWQIRNWRTTTKGAKTLLSLVVLMEPVQVPLGKFGLVDTVQYRVLEMIPGASATATSAATPNSVTGTVWAELAGQEGGRDYKPGSTTTYTNGDGTPVTEIPFWFVGAENNDCSIDEAPLFDLAVVNIGHYRNSADYEWSSFMTGQPTIAVIGIDQDWLTNVLKGTIDIGASGGIPLPVGADIKLLQTQPNTTPFEAMKHKESLMASMGARLAEAPSTQKTATQAAFDESSETSILSACSDNVSIAYLSALKQCALYMNESPDDIIFQLNKEFDIARLTPDDRRETVAEWQSEAISFTEMRARLRRANVATQDDDTARAEILADRVTFIPLALDGGVADPAALPVAGVADPTSGGPGNPPPAPPAPVPNPAPIDPKKGK